MVGIEGHVTHGLSNRSSLVALLNVGGPRSGSPETGHRYETFVDLRVMSPI